MQIVKSVRIKYFRSILNLTRGNIVDLPTNHLNIIVGSNDAGKSNYLRALNLFFNNEAEPGVPFEFWKNYSNQRHGIRREENRIEIELVIQPPKRQGFKNNGDVRWTKIWKENSILPEEHIVYVNGATFTSNFKSSYYKWLKKIKFKYVPAIKSEKYFNNLMFDLYDVLQKDTYDLENEFNNQVQNKTQLISQELNSKLNLESVLQFKGSFKELFNTLEFGTLDGKTMLNQRGDGIKVRHVPIILQNMAEAELKEERNREPIASTIWGFEEPENNLEFNSAKKLADNFIEYLDKVHFQDEDYSKYDEGIQIFITTHSPIFYTLGNGNESNISTFFVGKNKDESSSIKPIANDQKLEVESEMKLLPLIQLSKHWQNIDNKLNQLQKAKEELEHELNQITTDFKCIVFTEDEKGGLVDILLKANNFVEGDYDLRSYKGCSRIDSVEVLHKYLSDKYAGNCPEIVIHRDKDYLCSEEIEGLKNQFNKIGVNLFITKGTDIESYFTKLEHLQECHSELDIDFLKEVRKNALLEKKEKAISLIKTKEFGPHHAKKKSLLSDSIEDLYSKNEEEFFHGKEVLKKIKNLIQTETKNNANLEQTTKHLEDDSLKAIALKIWES